MNGDAETLDLFGHVEATDGAKAVSANLRGRDDPGKVADSSTAARQWRPDPVRHACPACGAWNWWSAGNGWTCRVCHPPASRRLVRATCSISHGFELIGLYEGGEPDEA